MLRSLAALLLLTAAASADTADGEALKAMPWDWRPWRWRDRARVELLRRRYEFSEVGGLAGVPATQQRLPFFEMIFEGMPLTAVGPRAGAPADRASARPAASAERCQMIMNLGSSGFGPQLRQPR